ncbi:hypothetical protein [Citrifermentans bremense]|nr:hypothetical protein [Citrifermentans bremense]
MTHPRQGWSEKFKEMAERGHDRIIGSELGDRSEWDEQEWEWNS